MNSPLVKSFQFSAKSTFMTDMNRNEIIELVEWVDVYLISLDASSYHRKTYFTNFVCITVEGTVKIHALL